jgi:hypothetical protein
MGKFGKELIESMQQAAKHAAGKKVRAKEIKPRRRTIAPAELSDERVQAIDSSRMDERHAHLDSVLEQKQRKRGEFGS